MTINGRLVCFASSFRQDGSRGGEETPNISHAVLDGSARTLCGRSGWMTDEGPMVDELFWPLGRTPDCLRCAASLRRASRS